MIDSVSINGAAIVGQPVEIVCFAHDPDGDELQFFWRASDGDILGSGAKVKFLPAPCCSGLSAKIEIAVRDTHGAEAKRQLTVFVL